MRRLGAIFLVLLLSISAVGSLAVAQSESDVSGGPFDREQLVENGVHDSDAPDSVRMLGDPVRGSVSVRHIPASPLKSEWQFVSPGETVKTDRVQLYSTAFGEATGNYTLVVVQWNDDMRTVQRENTSQKVPVATNQTVQRINVDIEEGYATEEIQLSANYDETREVTMWLERDGERLDGVTWRYQHTTVASGQAVDIQTQADAWWYAGRTAVLPGIAGIIAGLSLAKITLRQVGRGPGYGLTAWVVVGGLIGVAAVSGLYYEVAAVLAHFDILMGLSLGVVAYGGGLRMHPPMEKIAFERQELRDAMSLRGGGDDPSQEALADGGEQKSGFIEIPEDGYAEELYEDLPIFPTVRTEDGSRRVPMQGIGPFFARLFAKPALLDLSSLRTRVRVNEGSVAEKVYVSPDSDPAVDHKPARLKRRLPVWHRVADRVDDLGIVEKALYGVLTIGALGLPYIGWKVGEMALQTPVAGAAVGTVFLAIEAYGAHDGHIDFEPAPRHFLSANASLTILQDEFSDAKLLEEFEEIAWTERSRTAFEAREVESRRDRSIVQQMNERALGMDLGIVTGDSATERDESRAEDLLGNTSSGAEARADGGEDDE